MTLVNGPFHQSCRSKISSTCFICNRVTIRKSVFRILHDQSIFLASSFRISNAQFSEILNYWSSWFMLSIIRVFFTLGIRVYSRELVCVQHIRNSTADSLSRTTSCHAGFYIYGFQHYGFLWISSDLVHSLIEVLLIFSPSYLTLYYSEWVNLLKFWQCSFISRHQISIIMAPSEDVYIRQNCGDASILS